MTKGLPGDGQVRLDTLYTGLSAGTELTFLKDTNPYLRSRWDERAAASSSAASRALHYPVPFLGYMEVARVIESRRRRFAQRRASSASTYGHKSGHTADPAATLLVPLPPDLDPMLGIFVAQMGPIAANGILHADAELFGRSVRRPRRRRRGPPGRRHRAPAPSV